MRKTIFCIAWFMIYLGANAQTGQFEKIIFSSPYQNNEDFEAFSKHAKESGATHVAITNSLPRSSWHYDTPGDPYPAWYVFRVHILKVATPDALVNHIPQEYSEKIMKILEERCKILRKYGLKAYYAGSEPALLPESVYEEHPLWRGPRVDHPSRSKVARFAPSIENPEVQELYREAIQKLLKRCPEIDIITMLTNDSGSGLDWSPGLYNGQLGNTLYKNNNMADRINALFDVLRKGAEDANATLDLNLVNTREPEPERIAVKLKPGTAVDNLEGPDGSPFSVSGGVSSGYGNMFTPVYGIPQPLQFVSSINKTKNSNANRLFVQFSDHITRDFYFAIYDKLRNTKLNDKADEMVFVRNLAKEMVGDQHAAELLQLWMNTEESADYINLLHTGGRIFYLGCVHQRWLIRPFVPYPEEISQEIAQQWQKYQFQALPDRINNLADVQGTDSYYGWSGRHFVGRVLDPVRDLLDESVNIASNLQLEDLAKRFEVMICIVNNAYNAVSYQAQLDRVKELDIKPLEHAVIQTQSSWDRQLMMMTARAEIDNTAILLSLLGDNPEKYMWISDNVETKDIMLYGPDITEKLQQKINIMNAHWEDYKRMFTTPNW